MKLRAHLPALTREPSRLLPTLSRARTRPGFDAASGAQPDAAAGAHDTENASDHEMIPVRMMSQNLHSVSEL
eukprot:148678-Prymnesium_polylepis.1